MTDIPPYEQNPNLEMMAEKEDKVMIGYMDKVDFDFELGCAADGDKVFPSIEALRQYKSCCESCGIVEVEVRLKRVVQETDFSKRIEEAKARKAAEQNGG